MEKYKKKGRRIKKSRGKERGKEGKKEGKAKKREEETKG